MFRLTKKKPLFARLEAVDHPVLGRLEPSEEVSGVAGLVNVGGTTIDVAIAPDGGPMKSALALAADAVSRFAEIDLHCKALIAGDLLASYNSDWRFGAVQKADGTTEEFEKPLLNEAQFISALRAARLYVTGTGMVEISYEVGEMFWGHWVCVTLFDGLSLTDTSVELRG